MKLRSVPLLALSAVLLFQAQPAYSLNFDDLLKNYLGVSKGGGNTSQDLSSSEQSICKTNISVRQAQLEQQMQAGVQAGQLSANEENDLRANLNQIAATQGQYLADGGYNRTEVQDMLQQLNNFSIKLQTYLTNATLSQPGRSVPQSVLAPSKSYRDHDNEHDHGNHWYKRNLNGPKDGDISNSHAFRADVDTRQAQLDAAITDGVNSGRLSWHESSNLRQELDQIARNEVTLTADGRLSYSEAQDLINQLDSLNKKLTEDLNDRDYRGRGRHRGHGGYAFGQSLLKQRILAGMASKQLTKAEGNSLLTKENFIASQNERLRNDNGKITFAQQQAMLNQMDNISRSIAQTLAEKQVP